MLNKSSCHIKTQVLELGEGIIVQQPFAVMTWKLELFLKDKAYTITSLLIPLRNEIIEGKYILGDLSDYPDLNITTIAGYVADVIITTSRRNYDVTLTSGYLRINRATDKLNINYDCYDKNNIHLRGNCFVNLLDPNVLSK